MAINVNNVLRTTCGRAILTGGATIMHMHEIYLSLLQLSCHTQYPLTACEGFDGPIQSMDWIDMLLNKSDLHVGLCNTA